MMKKWMTYILAGTVLLASCGKEPIPTLNDPNAPDYGFRGKIDGEEFNIEIGKGDANLSFGTSEVNGIKTFYGQIDAPSEDFAMRIEVIEPERMPADLTAPDIELIEEDPDFFVHSPACIRMDFGSANSQLDYLLIQDDQGEYQPGSIVSFDEFGLYTISLKLADYGPQPFTVPIRYGFEYHDMNPKFTANSIGEMVTFNAENSYPFSEWYINGDLASASDGGFTVEMADGIHEIVHLIRDAAGNEASFTTLLRMTSGELAWVMDYDYCTSVDQNNYAEVMVLFKRGGVWYKSSKEPTNVGSKFDLGNISYITDESNIPTMAVLNIAFDAILKDDSQSLSLNLDEISGTIAVGLK